LVHASGGRIEIVKLVLRSRRFFGSYIINHRFINCTAWISKQSNGRMIMNGKLRRASEEVVAMHQRFGKIDGWKHVSGLAGDTLLRQVGEKPLSQQEITSKLLEMRQGPRTAYVERINE
jgi:hypothetical protein